jgi:hypothetical protein
MDYSSSNSNVAIGDPNQLCSNEIDLLARLFAFNEAHLGSKMARKSKLSLQRNI